MDNDPISFAFNIRAMENKFRNIYANDEVNSINPHEFRGLVSQFKIQTLGQYIRKIIFMQ